MNLATLHLSVPMKDVQSTKQFYEHILGCTITRSSPERLDINFFGHHLVAQLSSVEASHQSVTIGGSSKYPLRHYGVIVGMEDYDSILLKMRQANTPFAMQPERIFVGTPREQSVFLVFDPSGNALEIKGMDSVDNVFSTQ